MSECAFCGSKDNLSKYGALVYCLAHDDFYDTSLSEFPHG